MHKRFVAISCGLNTPKKDFNIISKRNLYLNYGLLGLCTKLKNQGYDIKQFQGEYLKPIELINIINSTEYSLEKLDTPILISIISFMSIEWCNELTRIIKCQYGLKCILGGKYVIDNNVEWLKNKLPYVDVFIEGSGENKIEDALKKLEYDKEKEENNYYDSLDYSLLYEFQKYNPDIELGRGCGSGCSFCADANRKQSPIKQPESLIDELHKLQKTYDNEFFTLYYSTANFRVNLDWINRYKTLLDKDIQNISFRCTSRIDSIPIELIPKLASIGLKVIDLGLESASPKQLLSMKKTKNPDEYLRKTFELIRVAHECGIWIKLNILLTAGETKNTINETQQWLSYNSKYIKGASANTAIIYGPNNNIMNEWQHLNASFIDKNSLKENGYSFINLSNDIDFIQATKYANILSKSVMTAQDYYDLKKYGYFSRDYNEKQFYQDIKNINEDILPFRNND